MGQAEQAAGLARIDQVWADLRQHREDIETIVTYGLPEPDDAETAEHHDLLVRMMACVVAMELDRRRLS